MASAAKISHRMQNFLSVGTERRVAETCYKAWEHVISIVKCPVPSLNIVDACSLPIKLNNIPFIAAFIFTLSMSVHTRAQAVTLHKIKFT